MHTVHDLLLVCPLENKEGHKILVTQPITASLSAPETPHKPVTLVLLPGLDGTEVFFRPLLAALPEWIAPLIVQFSTSEAHEYPDLLMMVRNMLVDAPRYYVLGWSFSGPLALMLATAEPEKVQGVVLVSTFISPPRRIFAKLRWAAVTPTVWMIRAGKRLPAWLFRSSMDRLRQDKTETWKRVTARMIAARIRTILAVDARDLLKRCPCPVLCVAGHDDGIVPCHNVQEMARVRESIGVRTITGGHFAIYTNPAGASEAITEFIMREMR
jgi:pimeloyl-ACP methyl ester carboxylesterase